MSWKAVVKKLKIEEKEKEKVQIIWMKLVKSSQKKQIKAKTVVYPRGTLLALRKIKTEPKKQKKKKPKVKVEVEIPKVDNKKRKRKNTDNIDDIAKIKKKENE